MVTRPIDGIIHNVQEYSETVVRDQAKEIDKNEVFPEETVYYLADLGVLRIPFYRCNGGLDGTLQDTLEVIQLVSKECASTSSVLLTQISFGITPIHDYGTQEQKNLYLPALLSGELLGAFAMNEIDIGSNLEKIETTAIEKEDGWELTGAKHFISLAGKAGIYSVAARTRLLNGEEDYGVFLVPCDTPGLTIGPQEEKMGIRGLPVAQLNFERVHLSKDAVLGGKPGGKEQVYAIKNYNKVFVAAQAIGLAQGVFERTLAYMQQDRRFGQRLIDLPNNQYKMATAYSEIYAAEAILEKIEVFNPDEICLPALVKLKASNVAVETAEMAMLLTGGYGYMRDNAIERYVRDSKLTQIYGGSSHTQMTLMSKPWLKRIHDNKGE